MSPSGYARAAAGMFAAEAVFSIVHGATASAYRGFSPGYDVTADVVLTVIWIAAAVVGLARKPRDGPAILFLGAALSLIQGFLFSIATSDVGPRGAGVPFLAASALQLYLIAHSSPAFAEAERAAREEPRERARPRVWHMGRLTWRPRHSQ